MTVHNNQTNRVNYLAEAGKITAAAAGGVVTGVATGALGALGIVFCGIVAQLSSGGNTLMGPSSLGGRLTYNIVGIVLIPVAIVGGAVIGVKSGIDTGKSIYDAL